jgi:sugar phosphate isomerase/epimerase
LKPYSGLLNMNRRDWCKNAVLGANSLANLSASSGSLLWGRQTPQFPHEFFAMDTATLRTLGELLTKPDIEAVAKLHYRGVALGALDSAEWRHLVEVVLPWLDETGLKLYAAYSWAHVDREQFTIDAGIKANLPRLKHRKTAIWPLITSKSFKPSDPAGDAMAVAAVRQMADDAAQYGCSVSLYPHAGTLVERVGDAVRIAGKADRHNVSVTFNLCHWLKTDGPDSIDRALKLAMPKLSLVTINGANREGNDWKQFIQPLDQGNFDIGALLRELKALEYRGPIGLQGYDVANNFHIEPIENLRRSMAAWTKLVSNLPPG